MLINMLVKYVEFEDAARRTFSRTGRAVAKPFADLGHFVARKTLGAVFAAYSFVRKYPFKTSGALLVVAVSAETNLWAGAGLGALVVLKEFMDLRKGAHAYDMLSNEERAKLWTELYSNQAAEQSVRDEVNAALTKRRYLKAVDLQFSDGRPSLSSLDLYDAAFRIKDREAVRERQRIALGLIKPMR